MDPRRPLLQLGEAEGEKLMSHFKEMIELEAEYSGTA
jgi:L-threo-3-deoxy-hexylosonate aldolase